MIVDFAETKDMRDAMADRHNRQRQKDAADALKRERFRQVEVGVTRMMLFIITVAVAATAAWVFDKPAAA